MDADNEIKPHQMKNIVYIMTDRNRVCLTAGITADLNETIGFYKEMAGSLFCAGKELMRIVYMEEFKTEAQALERYELIGRFTKMQKERLVRSCNPDWISLTAGSGLKHLPVGHARRNHVSPRLSPMY